MGLYSVHIALAELNWKVDSETVVTPLTAALGISRHSILIFSRDANVYYYACLLTSVVAMLMSIFTTDLDVVQCNPLDLR